MSAFSGGRRSGAEVVGTFDGDGNALGGTGFTVQRLGTGRYRVTFDNAMPSVPSVQITVGASAEVGHRLTAKTASLFEVRVVLLSTLLTVDPDTIDFSATSL